MRKKKFNHFIPCIVILSVNEENICLIEKKENKQLNYINDYAKSHNLLIMKIIKKGYSGENGKKQIFHRAVSLMEQGKAEALLIANMASISSGIADAYHRIGIIKERGFRIFTVDEGELHLNLHSLN